MIKQAEVKSIIIYLITVFLAASAQVLLKKAALSEHSSLLREYMNGRVVLGYLIMFGCTLMNVAAYQGMPLSLGMVLETTSYIYITIFGVAVFKEKLSKKRIAALLLICCGIILYGV